MKPRLRVVNEPTYGQSGERCARCYAQTATVLYSPDGNRWSVWLCSDCARTLRIKRSKHRAHQAMISLGRFILSLGRRR